MVEVEIRNPNVETFESPIVVEKIKGINQAHSYLGWIEGRIKVFQKRNNLEMVNILTTCKEVYNKFHGEELKEVENLKLEIEIIGKTKGIGTVEIYKGFDNNISIRVPIKDKETGVVKWMVKELKKEDLNRMIHIVKNLPINETVKCYEIAEKLGYDWKDVWKYRTKVYFPIYYFPLKFLEATKNIKYGGRGEVTRLI
jgi:hypothetical protein